MLLLKRNSEKEILKTADYLLREAWNHYLPVDVIPLLEALGIQAFETGFQGNTAALIDKKPGFDEHFHVHSDYNPAYKRWLYARLLGTYLFEGNYEEFYYIEQKENIFDNDFASNFARRLLLPEFSFKPEFSLPPHQRITTFDYNVPTEAIWLHFQEISK